MIDELRDRLIDHIDDMHALEMHVAHQLTEITERTRDAEFLERFRHHLAETQRHQDSLRERLEEGYRRSPSPLKEAGSIFAALGKGMLDRVRPNDPAKDARDAYVAEHLEIASYHVLEHLAEHAGDFATAELARRNRADEESMAGAIDARWEKVVHLSIAEGAAA